MVAWKPISAEALGGRISQGVARMPPRCKRLWEAIRIEPERWQLHPYGDAGGGFWVVAIIGRSVIWYNDVEEGFNRSRYAVHGEIGDYWCNQDELDVALAYLVNAIELGADLLSFTKPKGRRP